MPAHTRRCDPDSNQETWLIDYDDIRVGSISQRRGSHSRYAHSPYRGNRLKSGYCLNLLAWLASGGLGIAGSSVLGVAEPGPCISRLSASQPAAMACQPPAVERSQLEPAR